MSAEWIETKAYDCFGRELETHQCEYCGKVKPVKLWKGIENCRDSYNILMVEYLGVRCGGVLNAQTIST